MKLCHITISVKNLEDSLQFYQDIIGLPVKRRFSMENSTEIAFLGNGETEIELIYNPAHKDILIGQDISLGFGVESLQETMEFLKKKGIASEVMQVNPQLEFLFTSDPDGVRIQFMEDKE